MLPLRLFFQAYCVHYEPSFDRPLCRIRVLDETGFCCGQGCVEKSSRRLCSALNLSRVWSVGRASRGWVTRSECCLEQDSSLPFTSITGKSLRLLVVSVEFLVLVWRQPVPGFSRTRGWSGRPAAMALPGGEKRWCALLAIGSS